MGDILFSNNLCHNVFVMKEVIRMKENQLTKMFERFPHLKQEKGFILEVLLEDELNGTESAMKLFAKELGVSHKT